MKRIYLVIPIVVLVIGSVLVLTQYKSYQVIKEQNYQSFETALPDILFYIEKADKPWKLQIIIQESGSFDYVSVRLMTAEDSYLWSKILEDGTYEYEFINTGDLKLRFQVPSWGGESIQKIEYKIVAWKSFLGW